VLHENESIAEQQLVALDVPTPDPGIVKVVGEPRRRADEQVERVRRLVAGQPMNAMTRIPKCFGSWGL
jgi:hypothetical protein